MSKLYRFSDNLICKGFIVTVFLFSAATKADDKELEELRKNVPNEVKLNMEKTKPRSTDYCEPLNAPLLRKIISRIEIPKKESLKTETGIRDYPVHIDYHWGNAIFVKNNKGTIWASDALYLHENLTDQTDVKFAYFERSKSGIYNNTYVTACTYDVNGKKIRIVNFESF